ncbi:MAG: NTPase [Dehalococcoidia bacterium]|nr:NTPase [Dehalococcoidia bacterium]MDD5495450.1 NTPase [Dehalococcoidia bacterium]
MAQAYLLTGMPGTGKTSLIRQALTQSKCNAGGFFTQEIRNVGVREGFQIVTLDGKEGMLAHIGIESPFHVGKYAVDVNVLDDIGVNAIYSALESKDVVVIDEIGKMELFSPRFIKAVQDALTSNKKILGTITLKPHPLADTIKQSRFIRLAELTRNNQRPILAEILAWLK